MVFVSRAKKLVRSGRTKPDWGAIEKAAIAGVPYPELAKRFDVSLAAVKKQSSRGRWNVPARVIRRVKELQMSPNVTGDTAVTATAESLAQIGRRSAVLVASETAKLIAQTFRQKRLDAPGNWTELATANKVLRASTGQDRPTAAKVSLSVGLHPVPGPLRPPNVVIDAELLECDREEGDSED